MASFFETITQRKKDPPKQKQPGRLGDPGCGAAKQEPGSHVVGYEKRADDEKRTPDRTNQDREIICMMRIDSAQPTHQPRLSPMPCSEDVKPISSTSPQGQEDAVLPRL